MSYRKAFLLTMTIAVGLAVALVYFVLRTRQSTNGGLPPSPQQTEAVVPSSAAQPSEDQILSPVQLSPQRLQTIGVKFGNVVRRPVRYEIRATGNVEVNEE